MNDPIRRDTLLTAIGLSAMVVFFIFVVHRPLQKASDKAQAQIKEAEQTIRDIPLRLAELKSLEKDIQKREDYLKKTGRLVPRNLDLHRVLREVTDLTRNSDLNVTRLEPMEAVQQESYQSVPFRLSFTGDFRGIVAFSKGLESKDRLFSIDEFSLTADDEDRPGILTGDMHFSVYARRADISDFTENDTSSNRSGADRGIR